MGKGHRVTHLTKNKLSQSGLEEALFKGHWTVSGEFYRLSPIYRIYASIVNIQRKPTGSHCAYIDKEEKVSRYSSGEHPACLQHSICPEVPSKPCSYRKCPPAITNPTLCGTCLSLLTERFLACFNSYRAARPMPKRRRMDCDSFTVLKFPTPGQWWRCAQSSKVAWYIHTNSRLWPLLLSSSFMNIIISSCKIRVTCLIPSSICVEKEIRGSPENLIIPNWYFTLQTFTPPSLMTLGVIVQFLSTGKSVTLDFNADETLTGPSGCSE